MQLFSWTKPKMIVSEEGKQIRKAFYYQDDDYEILSLDYSQIELRILAELSNSKPLLDIFLNNLSNLLSYFPIFFVLVLLNSVLIVF